MAKRRKKNSLVLRYQRACASAMRKYCVVWLSDYNATCLVNLKTHKVHREIPEDLFDAITGVAYHWTVQLIVADKSDKFYTKGTVLQTTARYYVDDLTPVVAKEFKKLEDNFNPLHRIKRGYVAVPRLEDFAESQVEELLNLIGLWETNDEN